MNENVTNDIDETICSIGLFIRRELGKNNIIACPCDMVKALAHLVRARALLKNNYSSSDSLAPKE